VLRPEKHISANLQKKNKLISLKYFINCQIFLFDKKPLFNKKYIYIW